MTNKKNKILTYIKIAHTIIWLFFVIDIFYILYAGIFNKIDILLWIAIGLILLEGIILLVNKWKCPFTIVGYKYTESSDIGFDIYLPKWLAKYNKLIFTTIFIVGLLIVIYRLIE